MKTKPTGSRLLTLKTKEIKYFISILLIALLCACNACHDDQKKKNRLASAASPYLQQHADNPVDWYEWGDEPLAIAKKENKPLLISIGYASCHWCHEMEKESFMDTAVARIMNENFVCIKIDREERPDIDNIYMYACKLISGGGGWPLNAFALPDGKPFFAGTYYTKNSWKNLTTEISKAYREKKKLVIMQAEGLTKGIVDETLSFNKIGKPVAAVSTRDYKEVFDSVILKLDRVNGGLTGVPKFPMPAVTEFLLQYYYQSGDKLALDAANTSLTKMALGGIYDQVGGGFARYSTDASWRVPHFEKMLYDNAQLLSLYTHAYQLTQNDLYWTVVSETISFVERELASPEGGFFSSLNADTENGEGEFYTWDQKEFRKISGEDNLLSEYFNIKPSGNWKNGKNILSASYTPTQFAIGKKILPGMFAHFLNTTKAKLLSERNRRTRPSIDTKILTSWNAMLLKAYTDVYQVSADEKHLAKTLQIGIFLEKNMIGKDGSIKRVFKDGKASVDGFLDDYAWTAHAFAQLYQVSFDKRWLDLSRLVLDYAIRNFYDKKSNLFYYSHAQGVKLVVNYIETSDEAIPSSNSIMAKVLYSLGIIYDKINYIDLSKEMLKTVSGKLKSFPVFHANWASLTGLFANGTYEVAVMGKDAIAMNKSLQRTYLPDCIMMGGINEENLPLLQNKLPEDGTLIYVCTNRVCKKPVEEVQEAILQIRNKL